MSGVNWARDKMRQRMARQGSEVAVDKADLLKASKDDLRKMANKLIADSYSAKAREARETSRPHRGGKKKGGHKPWETKPRGAEQDQPTIDRAVRAGLVIYSDGCCEPNPGAGGYGFVAYLDGQEIHAESGGAVTTTNNIMEMTGALMALRWLVRRPDRAAARLLCDSQYVVNGCNDWRHGWKKKGWKRGEGALANADLWKELDAELTAMPLRLEWCKGHAGIVGNERADELSLIGRDEALEAARAADPIRRQLAYAT